MSMAASNALAFRESSQKQKIVAGLGLESVRVGFHGVVDDPGHVQAGEGSRLLVRHRDEGRRRVARPERRLRRAREDGERYGPAAAVASPLKASDSGAYSAWAWIRSKDAACSMAAARLKSSHSSHGQSAGFSQVALLVDRVQRGRASLEPPVANSVTSCPRSTSPLASRAVTVSIDPDRGGGTGWATGATSAMRSGAGPQPHATSRKRGSTRAASKCSRAISPARLRVCGVVGIDPREVLDALPRASRTRAGPSPEGRCCAPPGVLDHRRAPGRPGSTRCGR